MDVQSIQVYGKTVRQLRIKRRSIFSWNVGNFTQNGKLERDSRDIIGPPIGLVHCQNRRNAVGEAASQMVG